MSKAALSTAVRLVRSKGIIDKNYHKIMLLFMYYNIFTQHKSHCLAVTAGPPPALTWHHQSGYCVVLGVGIGGHGEL